jgi:hypothetical protein
MPYATSNKEEELDQMNLNDYKSQVTENEYKELEVYITIFKTYGYRKHWEVNKYITLKGLWDEFPTIRSRNDHDKGEIKGIMPEYFKIICNILNVDGDGGSKINAAKRY